jgi:hypothetical protein
MLKIEFILTRFWKATIQTTKKNYEQIIQRWILEGNRVQLRNIQWCYKYLNKGYKNLALYIQMNYEFELFEMILGI